MKTLLITKENRQQIVLTPETEFEKSIVKMFHSEFTFPQPIEEKKKPTEAQIYLGEFYDCRGGWTREGQNNDSLIIVFDKKSN